MTKLWDENNKVLTILILSCIVIKAIDIINRPADLSLWGTKYTEISGGPELSTWIPYGVLWTWLNPIQWGIKPYQYFIFTFDMAMLAIQIACKRLPYKLIAATQVLTCTWYTGFGLEQQNVTITAFAPFLYLVYPTLRTGVTGFISRNRYAGVFGGIALLQKLPIGWSLPWVWNDHLSCVFQCIAHTDPLWDSILEMARSANYLFLILAFLLPFHIREGAKHDYVKWGLIGWIGLICATALIYTLAAFGFLGGTQIKWTV